MLESLTIDRRYRGPLDSANGGYAAGLLGCGSLRRSSGRSRCAETASGCSCSTENGSSPRRPMATPGSRPRPCVVVGWPLGDEGRKLHAGTALYGRDRELLALARQVWIIPRAG